MNYKDIFIFKSSLLHNNKYCYENVVYVNSVTKVEIICPVHGLFQQLPKTHIKGHGCRKCSGNESDSIRFFEKVKTVHGDLYDYSESIFVNSLEKIQIICKTHGKFELKASKHLEGSGCQKCSSIRRNKLNSITNDEFLSRASKIHNNKYIYVDNYIAMKNPISIKCSEHGIFRQEPRSHLNGNGCPYCVGVIRTTKRFIEKAKQIHGDFYTYKKTNYIRSKDKIIITCPNHNDFLVTASEFLRGSGCPGCMVSHPEKIWLDRLNVPVRQKKIYKEDNKNYIIVDGYDPKTNTVYEYNGDFWHGNPKIYEQDKIHPIRKISFGELYQLTIERERFIKEKGFNLISVWSNDIDDKFLI